jgi:hypothetical protein
MPITCNRNTSHNNNTNSNNSMRKVKVKVTLEQDTKAQLGSRGIALHFIPNLGTRWGWVVSAMLWPLYPQERPSTHCTGGWVGLRTGLDRCGKSRPHRDSITGPSSPYRITILTELSRPTQHERQVKLPITAHCMHSFYLGTDSKGKVWNTVVVNEIS